MASPTKSDDWNELVSGEEPKVTYGAIGANKQLPPKPPASADDAIIYVPGMDPLVQNVRDVGQRLKAALHKNVTSAKFKCSNSLEYHAYGSEDEFETLRCSISRTCDATEYPLADIYQLDYVPDLEEYVTGKSLLTQLFMLLSSVVLAMGWIMTRLCRCCRRGCFRSEYSALQEEALWSQHDDDDEEAPTRGKRWGSMGAALMHLLVLFLVFGLLTGYLLFLMVAVVSIFFELAGHEGSNWFFFCQGTVVFVTALALLCPSSWKAKLVEMAVLFTSLTRYYTSDAHRRELSSQLDLLVKQVYSHNPPYKRLHLVGCSMGGIIALDGVYHQNRQKEYTKVASLVTLACPLELASTYVPWYYDSSTGPQKTGSSAAKWTNIYVPADVLGSILEDENHHLVPDTNVMQGPQVSGFEAWINHYLLFGLAAHGQYWSSKKGFGNDVSHHIVKAIFENHPWALSDGG